MASSSSVEQQTAVRTEFCELLKATPIQALFSDEPSSSREIVSVADTDSVETALQKLRVQEVRSAPITRSAESSSHQLQFVDYMDVVAYLVSILSRHAGSDPDAIVNALKSKEIAHEFFSARAVNIANFSKKDSLIVGNLDWNALQVCNALASGAKRVVILENGKVAHIVTHSDILTFLLKHDSFAAFKQTVESLALGTHHIVSIKEDALAIHAFMLINEKKLSALPILSEDGEVISVVSSRDMRLLVVQSVKNFDLLSVPIMDFIRISRQVNLTAKTSYPYIWCKMDSTLELVMKRLHATHVHRLIIVNNERQPIGVLSLTDLIALLADDVNKQ